MSDTTQPAPTTGGTTTPPASGTGETEADKIKPTIPEVRYIVFSLFVLGIGFLLWGLLGGAAEPPEPKAGEEPPLPAVSTVVGITIFAGLYIFAQGIERWVALTFPLLDGLTTGIAKVPTWLAKRRAKAAGTEFVVEPKRTIEATRANARFALRSVGGTIPRANFMLFADTPPDPTEEDKKKAAEAKAKLEKAAAGSMWSKSSYNFAIALPIAAAISFSLSATVGITVWHWLETMLVALTITGGGAALHDLITKIKSSSDRDQSETA